MVKIIYSFIFNYKMILNHICDYDLELLLVWMKMKSAFNLTHVHFVTMISYSHNSSWTKQHILSHLWTTLQVAKTIKFSFILLDITNCEWYGDILHSPFSFKLIIIINHICNLKPFCNWICDYKSFSTLAMEDNWNDNCKNGWIGHKLQTHGLVYRLDSL
jgi:hypothetical protein